MFGFLKNVKKNKQLDDIIQKIEMNMSNNYKDAAQANLKELETTLQEFTEAHRLSDKQKNYYEEILRSFKERMKNFTHKDQKPTWV